MDPHDALPTTQVSAGAANVSSADVVADSDDKGGRRKSEVSVRRNDDGHAMLRMRLPTDRLRAAQTGGKHDPRSIAPIVTPSRPIDQATAAPGSIAVDDGDASSMIAPSSPPPAITIDEADAGPRTVIDAKDRLPPPSSGASTPLGGGDRSTNAHAAGGTLPGRRKASTKKKAGRASLSQHNGDDAGGFATPGSGASTPLPGASNGGGTAELTKQNMAILKSATASLTAGGKQAADTVSNTGTATGHTGGHATGGGGGAGGGNTGPANSEQLRLLDRSGRPCRRWTLKPHRVHALFGGSFRVKVWTGAEPVAS